MLVRGGFWATSSALYHVPVVREAYGALPSGTDAVTPRAAPMVALHRCRRRVQLRGKEGRNLDLVREEGTCGDNQLTLVKPKSSLNVGQQE